MHRFVRWGFALALLPIAACSSSNPPPAAEAPPAPALSSVDQAFLQQVAASDAFEIQSSQLAATKARRPAVKDYANHMVQMHTQTSQQLAQIAQSKGAPPPAGQPDAEHQQLLTKLQGETGPRFERDYLAAQLAGHQAAAQLFQQEIDQGQDADLKAFAQQTLPTIQGHLQAVQQLAGGSHPAAHHGHGTPHHHVHPNES